MFWDVFSLKWNEWKKSPIQLHCESTINFDLYMIYPPSSTLWISKWFWEIFFFSFFLEIEITNVVYIVSWFLKMKNHGGVTQFLMYDVQMMCSTLCDPNLFQENAIFFQQIFFPSTPPQNDRRSRSTHCFTLTNYITTEEKVLKKNLSWKKNKLFTTFLLHKFFFYQKQSILQEFLLPDLP